MHKNALKLWIFTSNKSNNAKAYINIRHTAMGLL